MNTLFYKSFLVSLFIFLVFTIFSLTFLINPAFCNDMIKEDILTALELKYRGKSFKADFEQVSKLAALDITEKASGTSFFSHPGKMRWQYLSPQFHEIITNGKSLWIYRPEENQVMVGDASHFFKSGAGGAFLSDISLIRKKFTITVKKVNSDYAELNLSVKEKRGDISSIVIRILQKNSEIERVVTYNPYNDTTRLEFKNIRFGNIDPETFEFQIPDKADIIEMD